MSIREYMEDCILTILTCIFVLIIQSFLLYFLGNNIAIIFMLDGIWIFLFLTYFLLNYARKHKRMNLLTSLEARLDKKYLLHEVLPKNGNHEELFYKRLLYIGNKAMIEEVSNIRRDRQAYQEYIEQWVHEIKTPLAAMKLWSENQQSERKRDLLQQLERTENYVDQALYYARSEHVQSDFHIHQVDLCSCIHDSILRNKYVCMQANVHIEVPQEKVYVYTDEKWIVFILNQLIENAIKYRHKEDPRISITIEQVEDVVHMHIQDNGLGISTQDLPQVFEKGFTGANGRSANQHATGIGLYLCKRLCDALALDIKIESSIGVGTTLTILFSGKSYKAVSTL